MSATGGQSLPSWEDAGARVAGALGTACAVLVTGPDALASARAAIGIGRVECARRRVAIGDLVGDVGPLVALVHDEDAHGLIDSFLYGVSLNKVAHPVSGADNLFVMPSGSEPELVADIIGNDRWRRLASGFREVGALLLLVAPADAPGIDALVGMLDGAVVVGDESGRLAARLPVLAVVDGRAEPVRRASARVREPQTDTGRRRAILPPAEAPARPWLVPLLVLLLAMGAGGAWWWTQRAASAAPGATRAADTLVAAPATRDTLPVLVPVNPADSAAASAYAVEVAKYNTEEGARLGHRQAAGLPGATWFALRLSNDPGTWYRVIGGSWTTRAAADSALAALRAAGAVQATTAVVRTPLALLVGSALGPDSLRARTARYEQGGVPVYPLRQDDGTTNLYAGAFETPDQSMFLALALQQMGDVPTLVYRTGRAP